MNNYALLSDFYEFTMANGYFRTGMKDKVLYFDLFYRTNPDTGGFAIACGLAPVIEQLLNLQFNDDDIDFLRSKAVFSEDFLSYLKTMRFSGDLWAVPEGTVVFPNEPILTVRAKAIEAQLIETMMLLIVNHQSLIATKANRIVRAASGRTVLEFGARRAHGFDASVVGARSAYIAGVPATSNTLVDKLYGIPSSGTMAHSWVQIFDDEYQAFDTYCSLYPNSVSLLVDTYNVLKSGVPNAIKALKNNNISSGSIRLDSGDIAYLSVRARNMLDEAGLPDIKIVASSSLDESIIRDIIAQGGQVDVFGVGERLITAKSDPVFGGVYKLVAAEDDHGNIIPKIKISENIAKITTPHFKQIYRLYDNESSKAEADLLCIHDEKIDFCGSVEIFDPDFPWKRKILNNITARELLVPILKEGELVYDIPSLKETRNYCEREVESIWDEVKRFENPHDYYVDLSQTLWDVKQNLLSEERNRD
ncbi:MAG: nicotinate phosphoribosyltransferase [Oscillospiraceae bacterium]|nr:nicotinate phosphoribosyltransferase [Oscillospiraceae bacterium]